MAVQALPTRVWRNYSGGLLLDRGCGVADPRDSRLPEDWLCSTTRANNARDDSPPDEGLSRYRAADGSTGLLADLLPEGMGVLCKFLDPCERLQVQWHPDPAFARRHFGIDRGKTELWIGFEERSPGAGHAWLGQRNDWTREDWKRAIDEQDTAAMLDALHRIDIAPGDAWLMPAGVPHCLGGGGLYLEVQEPTDFTVRCEYRRDGVELPVAARWMGLDQERALDCLRCGAIDPESLHLHPRPADDGPGWRREILCGREDCPCFAVDIIDIDGSARLPLAGPQVLIVLAGKVDIDGLPGRSRDRFALLPDEIDLAVAGRGRLLACRGTL